MNANTLCKSAGIGHRRLAKSLALVLSVLANQSYAGTLAQIPLLLGSSTLPNVILAVDNSSSMNYEVVMASSTVQLASDYYSFPGQDPSSTPVFQLFPDGYGNIGFTNNIPPLPLYADARAAAANRAYFDPTQKYVPWTGYGTLVFENVKPEYAPWFPMPKGSAAPLVSNTYGKNFFDLTADTRTDDSGKSYYGFYAYNGDPGKDQSQATYKAVYVPAGTWIKPSLIYGMSPANNKTGCTNPTAWCKVANGGLIRDKMLGIQYYPATFYLPHGTALPPGYSSYKSNCVIGNVKDWQWTATSPNQHIWDGYEIRKSCFEKQSEYDDAIQNFANWFTYYRKRRLAALGSIGASFKNVTSMMFSAFPINPPKIDNIKDLADLSEASNADTIFSDVYAYPFAGETPSRDALINMGEKLGPLVKYRCQKSFGILISDGADSGTPLTRTSPSIGGEDNAQQRPFGVDDTGSGYLSLGDIAMYYYSSAANPFPNSLIAPIPAACPNVRLDCNTKPHMNFYAIGMGLRGNVFNPDAAVDPFDKSSFPTWPTQNQLLNTESIPGGTLSGAKVDDLWHSAINGRGEFLNASRPSEVRERLLQIIRAINDSSGSASAVSSDSAYVTGNNLVYQSRFDSTGWVGEVAAYRFNSLGTPIVDTSSPVWRASLKIPSHSQRKIFTRSTCAAPGTTPIDEVVEFTWSNLGCDQAAVLADTDPPPPDGDRPAWGQARLDYLRGRMTGEVRNGGQFRDRLDSKRAENVLGDIVNSAPALAGTEDYGYEILPGTEGTDYREKLMRTKASRTQIVYVGANDGMLHGFDATQTSSGGTEVFAYIPKTVYAGVEGGAANIASYTAPNYRHRYFVDGTPRILDAYLERGWTNMLLGTTGAGGRGIFAVDVTYPDKLGADSVMWEVSAIADDVLPNLGYSISLPTVVRTHSSAHPWVVIAANGNNSPSGKAVLLIIDPENGTILREIDTLADGNSDEGGLIVKNGLSTPVVVDIEQDRIADLVYAGDLEGNLWKFDLRSTDYRDWGVAYGTAAEPAPLFVACASHLTPACSAKNRQPITAKPQVAATPMDMGGVLIYFGTGQYIEDSDKIVNKNSQTQTFYGLWDKNGLTSDDQIDNSNSVLVQQTILDNNLSSGGSVLRITSNNPVDYSKKNGWYLDLRGTDSDGEVIPGERVVTSPVFHDGRITFASFVPTTQPCEAGGQGWITELEALTGNRVAGTVPIFDINKDNKIDAANDLVTISGGVGSPSAIAVEGVPSGTSIMRDSDYIYRLNSLSSGAITVSQGRADPSANSRISWRQVR